MPIRALAPRSPLSLRGLRWAGLLAGTSMIALAAGSDAHAGSLRDTRATASAAAAAATAATASTQAAQTAATQALTRLKTSLRSMRDAQAAARAAAAAAASTVPNGLTAGGLVPASGATPTATTYSTTDLWQGANLPTSSTTAAGRTTVEVKQTEQKAILTWESFNVGAATDLYFNQTAGGSDVANWVALNRVLDPTAAPSQILGTIKAEGQVYVINQNGIVFGGTSQVNVGALVASSLSLTNAQLQAGINTQLYVAVTGGNNYGIPTFGVYGSAPATNKAADSQTGALVLGDAPGDVTVEAGAVITTASGGKALLFAPHVTNAGIIAAPDGQVILAAGENVWLSDRLGYVDGLLTTVRGLDVAVSAPSKFLYNYSDYMGAIGKWTAYGNYTKSLYAQVLTPMVERAASVGYSVTNTGIVTSERGVIIMQGREVNQLGALYATTALDNQAGEIILRAWGQGMYAHSSSLDYSRLDHWSPGTLTLGVGSVTLVEPDLTDTSTIETSATDTLYTPGSITLRGLLIDIESNASVVAVSGTIVAVASAAADASDEPNSSDTSKQNDGSRIYIGEDAYVSVAGLADVTLSVSSNVVAAELRVNELRDSVLYADSWLTGETIYVDKRKSGTFTDSVMSGVDWVDGETGAWVGTPLADVTGWVGTGTTTLAELATTGGTITLKSGGDIITRSGSVIDISGGAVTYTAGLVDTTKLLGADGKIYDISEATPDRVYVGLAGDTVVGHDRWGVTETYSNKLRRTSTWEEGYTEGRAAGSLAIYQGSGLVLEGAIEAGVITGEHQAASGQTATAGTLIVGGAGNEDRLWLASNIVITSNPVTLPSGFTASSALPSSFSDISGGTNAVYAKTVYLNDDMLSGSGLGTIELYFNGTFTLAADARVDLAAGTSLSIGANAATSITTHAVLDGSITSPGGSVYVTTGNLTLGSTAVLDVGGEWYNSASTGAVAPTVDGGSVALNGALTVAPGAIIDVSGGGWYKSLAGEVGVSYGDAGSIRLGGLDSAALAALDLRAFAAGSGGSLVLTLDGAVQIGGTDPGDGTFYLPATLFGDSGFRSVSITADTITVPDGVTATLVPTSIDLIGVDLASVATGTRLSEVGTIRVLDLVDRANLDTTSIDLSSTTSITIGTGASLTSDVGGSIDLTQLDTSTTTGIVRVNGTVSAPAGRISVSASNVVLGEAARLHALGEAVVYTDPTTGLRSGEVLDGGSITLSGTTLDIATTVVIDASGTSATIDVVTGRSVQPLTLASDGGSISITLPGQTDLEATLIARAGGSGAAGGTLTLIDGATASSSSGSTTTIPTYLGYYDPTTGKFTRKSYSSFDLDLYDEFGTDAIKLTSAERTAINALKQSMAGGIVIVDGSIPDEAISMAVDPWVTNSAIREAVVYLINKYFYNTVNATTPSTKITIADVALTFSRVSDTSFRNGGFSTININTTNALGLTDGLDLSLPQTVLNITAQKIIPVSDDTVARIQAAAITLARGTSTVPAWSATSSGTVTLEASLIEIERASLRGFAETELAADEIRFVYPALGTAATLDVDGTLVMTAAQIYPATETTATVTAADKIVVLGNGSSTTPLSAGGSLTLSAPDIEVYGTLRAPFGSVTLAATNSVTLGEGALVSVSGDGLVVPYGVIYDGEYWARYASSSDPEPDSITELPAKSVTLDAPTVTIAGGATIDVSGGGDLFASQFIAGTGGSHSVLAMSNTYAIVPLASYASVTAPAGSGIAAGSKIYLAGGNGVAAGWYVLLPAQYALVDGAYAVQLVSGTTGTSIKSAVTLADGSVLMAGSLANGLTGTFDQQSSLWRVMSGDVVRSYSEYAEARANTYFASDDFKTLQYRLTGTTVVTPRLPMDGGSLVLQATSSLTLDGTLRSSGVDGGRGGLVDIAGAKIAVVGAGQSTSDLTGYLIIDADQLSAFGIESLLLGGVRTPTASGMTIAVTAGSIVVRNDEDTALTGPEIVLAATGDVTVAAGSVIRAEGTIAGGGGDLIMTEAEATGDHGVLLRVSNGDAVGVIRANVDSSSHALLTIGEGAVVAGGASLMLDATGEFTLAGSAGISGTAVTLGSSRISFGATGAVTGVAFGTDALTRFAGTEVLTLQSYSTIDFYAGVDFGAIGLDTVVLDTAGLVGYTSGTVTVAAGTIALQNTSGRYAGTSTSSGTLVVAADDLVLAAGDKTLGGFAAVTLSGATTIRGLGTGSLDAGSAGLTLAAPLITSEGGSNQSVVTTGMLAVIPGGGGVSTAARDFGSQGGVWSFTGASVSLAGRIDALGGSVGLTATAGDVTLASGAVIDVGGYAKTFYDVVAYADSGDIALTAVGGDVRVLAGSALTLSADAGGGDAGSLSATASGGGTVVLAGAIDAHAASGRGGSFALDVAALADFSAFSSWLDTAGFSGARTFRIRNGDVVIDGTTTAETFVLSADTGSVTVSGTIDARSTYGGTITITGGGGLTMTSDAVLTAAATSSDDLGSARVTLEATGGTLDIRGGSIDVSGGDGGKVVFRALQNATHDGIAVASLAPVITGARLSTLDGVAVYSYDSDVTIDSALAAAYTADAATFVTWAATSSLGAASGILVMPAIEVRSTGDIAVTADWDLSTMSAHAGTLTLRAAGNLVVTGNISDGFDGATRSSNTLLGRESWNLRLAAGADLSSAGASAVRPNAALADGEGGLTLGSTTAGSLVRTGTGDITIAAAGDIGLVHYQSAIYTAGRADPTVYSNFSAPSGAQYGVWGGNLAISAGGDISSVYLTGSSSTSNMNYAQWLKTAGSVNSAFLFLDYTASGITNRGQQSTWYVDYSGFVQGVGALGGGNVGVDAGGDLDNLVVALATTGRVLGGTTTTTDKQLVTNNGGLLSVDAGGTIYAGYYYIARGAGEIEAAALAVGHTVTVGSTVYSVAPVLSLGDASLRVTTKGDMRVQGVIDPLMAYDAATGIYVQAYMLGVSERATLELVSVGGDVVLVNQANHVSDDSSDSYAAYYDRANLYPSITTVVALDGNVSNLARMIILPGSEIDLRILAADDVTPGTILMSRAVREMLPSAFVPSGGSGSATQYVKYSGTDNWVTVLTNYAGAQYFSSTPTFENYLESVRNPTTLPNAGDHEPSRIYALDGTIWGGSLTANESVQILAGTDIRNPTYAMRNLHEADTTWISAGRDIVGGTYQIDGPGSLLLTAGRDVYSTSGLYSASPMSILASGNQVYSLTDGAVTSYGTINGLPETGASIEVIAGLNGQQPAYAAFMAAYLDPTNVAVMSGWLTTTVGGVTVPLYLTDAYETLSDGTVKQTRFGLVSYVAQVTGRTLSASEAWDVFQTLPALTQQRFVRSVYVQELRAAGRDQSGDLTTGGYDRGYTAIATLFPGDGWDGDIQFGNAFVRTNASDGDIRLLAPGGGVQVASLNTAPDAGYGIVSLDYGRIEIVARDDVMVNASRILTFGGGDVTIWSTVGDVDAGRGAKTTRIPVSSIIDTDEDGVTRIIPQADFSGSGIGTVEGFTDVEPGDVDLIAPEGTVNAGDAGIRVSGDFNVAARFVLNMDNIKVSGETKGVPKEDTKVAPLAVETQDKTAAEAAAAATQQATGDRPSVIIVEILGYGGGGEERTPDADERDRRSQVPRPYDVDSAVQLVGNGSLGEAQLQALTVGERRNLARR
ncbi:filamentous hemagglutinin family protein [Rhodoplanes sp. TEM]|uniref:Filamentous hemagglutinin family protein n=1 Tax=Rhodoplanes tepidamans TaxID=200616 RepID=A0ABT5JBH4_RHOTP|nr:MULTISPECIES: filamentous haemagglutinin family protein [Rhodoplanes]MDC7787036.1 filamentous hemagglutinin family protein [Rhodoplanes tepidamans]MDC7985266.1 filamentous hemagglutinin family protein [Rhodoplanes sp. TEM]MDQ0354238.1 filamentous hemagglutinin family protein [Rhodoplanes tepidamans]